MTTALLPKVRGPRASEPPNRGGRHQRRTPAPRHYVDTIEGRYRPIHAHQLALAWWLYQERHITFRQLRTWFAAQEMAERRNYGRTRGGKEDPVFPIEELLGIIGGRGNARTERDVQRELRQLHELGLLQASKHELRFAKSIDTVTVGEGGGDAFRAFLQEIPNRTVPVPRRLIRALAAGFRQADTAYVIAFLLRSVHWRAAEKRFTVDGRMLLGKTARHFGFSPRAFTDARAHLLELGWISALDVPQWQSNKWGVHDVVNVHWTVANDVDNPSDAVGSDIQSARPSARSDSRSASPDQTRTLPSEIENTRRPEQPDRSGVSFKKDQKGGSSKKLAPATIHDIQPHDLRDTDRLLDLHRQFVARGEAHGGEAGVLDFLSLANRARTRGSNPGGLLRRLLQLGKTEWITVADEEDAARRLREHRNGPAVRASNEDRAQSGREGMRPRSLTEDDQFVEKCIRVSQMHRGIEPWRVAAHVKQWDRDQWRLAEASYRTAQARDQKWHGTDDAISTLEVRFA